MGEQQNNRTTEQQWGISDDFKKIVDKFESGSKTLDLLPMDAQKLNSKIIQVMNLAREIALYFNFNPLLEKQPKTFKEQLENVLVGNLNNVSCRMPTLVMAEILRRKYQDQELVFEFWQRIQAGKPGSYAHPTLRIFNMFWNQGITINFNGYDKVAVNLCNVYLGEERTFNLLGRNSYLGVITEIDKFMQEK